MPLNMNDIPKKPSAQRALLTAGSNMARLVQVIDLGLQERMPFKGQDKPPAYELYLTFEFPDERIEVDGESRPMWKSKRIVQSTFDKSNCVKWYNVLDPTNKHRGNWGKLLGQECAVLIVHEEGKGKNAGRTFDKIADIMPLMKGVQVPPLENDPVSFDTLSPNMEVFEAMPDFLQNIIKGNLEFDGSKLQRLLEGSPTPYTARAPGDAPEDQDSDDPRPDVPDAGDEDGDEPW